MVSTILFAQFQIIFNCINLQHIRSYLFLSFYLHTNVDGSKKASNSRPIANSLSVILVGGYHYEIGSFVIDLFHTKQWFTIKKGFP